MEAVEQTADAAVRRGFGGELRRTALGIAVTFGIAVLMSIATAIRVISDVPVTLQLLYAGETLFAILPVAAGLCIAFLRTVSWRGALLVAGATTLTMAGVDLLPSTDDLWERSLVAAPADRNLPLNNELRMDWKTVGGLRIVGAHLSGTLPYVDEPQEAYGSASPRWVVLSGYMKVSTLPLPFAIVGLIAGTLGALRRNVFFASSRVELAVRTAVGSLGTLAIVGFVQHSTSSLWGEVLFDGLHPGFLAAPTVTFLLVSLAGWLTMREVE